MGSRWPRVLRACGLDPRQLPWGSFMRDDQPAWSAMHLQPTAAKQSAPTIAEPAGALAPSDQLAVTYALPLRAGEAGSGDAAAPAWAHVAASVPARALRVALNDPAPGWAGSEGTDRAAAFIMENVMEVGTTDADSWPLVASYASDEELRAPVGGQWYTTRRNTTESVDSEVVRASRAVRWLCTYSGRGAPPSVTLLSTSTTALAIGACSRSR